jgi:signal transduction histidine kinase
MKNLTTRLVILLMLALLAITGVYDYLRLVRERQRLFEQTQEDERIFAETLALAVSRNIRWGRTSADLKELLDDILARPGLVGVAIYDPTAKVVAQTVAPGAQPPAPDEVVREVLKTKEAASATVMAGSSPVSRYIQPFRWSGGRTAAIEVRQTLDEMERAFRREIRERVISRLIVLAAFVLSVMALTRWSIARPIRALIHGARAVGKGDLDQRIIVARRDEIGQLAEEFNRMATNLQAARQEVLRQAEDRLRLEQEAQQAQKMAAVGMLAAEVAHEIGTPLNIISGRAEALARTFSSDHARRRQVDVIVAQADRITHSIRALLDYARPRQPALREVDLVPLLARVADLVNGRCVARGVHIQLDIPPALPRVMGDEEHLQQLFLNLLMNAVDASPRGETIRILTGPDPTLPQEGRAAVTRGRIEGPALAVHILDRGKGIPADRLESIFQPFFSTKERGQGTGLGLPIVEEIIRAHRGEVEILSIPGAGTEVVARLPLAGAAPAAPGAAAEPAPAAADHAS